MSGRRGIRGCGQQKAERKGQEKRGKAGTATERAGLFKMVAVFSRSVFRGGAVVIVGAGRFRCQADQPVAGANLVQQGKGIAVTGSSHQPGSLVLAANLHGNQVHDDRERQQPSR